MRGWPSIRDSRLPLVIVGGYESDEIHNSVVQVGRVPEAELRWLYRHCSALVATAHEDFGLTPIEANAYGRPVVALRRGGYLDSMVEGKTAIFTDSLEPDLLKHAVNRALDREWHEHQLRANAARFSLENFVQQIKLAARQAISPQ